MQKHFDPPGSPAWAARRAGCFNAGDAPAMLGCDPNGRTRSQLLHELHTGLQREFSDYVQERVLDQGHRVEALWRPIAEDILDEELAVFAVTLDVGLSRPLGASLDGGTLMDDTLGECKSANDSLRAALPHTGRDSHARNDARQLPKGYRVQMEQQQLATGATRTLFSACQFDNDGNVIEERHCFYVSDVALRAEILAGWAQFEKDLAAYTPEPAAAPAAVAAPMESLPAVQVRMDGALTVHSNLSEYAPLLRAFIDQIPVQPSTDQEFADCEAACKALKRVEEDLQAEEARALAGMADVEKMRRIVSDLSALARTTRLQREKLVKARKDQLRLEQVQRGRAALAAHLQSLNQTLGAGLMPDIPANFAGVIAKKQTIVGIRDAIDTELARAKILAGEAFQRISANLATLRENAEHKHLFPDVAIIVQKAPDDLQSLAAARIAAHRAAEEKRAAELAERERARIRAEEQARAQREAQEVAAREQRQRDEAAALERRQREEAEAAARQAAETEQPARTPAPAPIAAPAPSSQAGNVLPMPTKAPAGLPTLRLGVINERLGRCKVTADDLAALGFPAAGRDRAAVLYHEHSFAGICDALIANIAQAKLAKAA
jgi:predicted phage-related endonuclease